MTRIAWWAFFATPVVLLAMLLVARPASALTLHAGPISGPTLSTPFDEEDEESEAEELEAEEDEEEEFEDEEAGLAPPECLLQTAHAQAFAYLAQNKIKLLIRYTSTEATVATVSSRLSGSKGGLKLPSAKQHLSESGVIRLTESLSPGQTSKVAAAHSFTVEIHIPAIPHFCQRFDTLHLTIEHAGGNRLTWHQAKSTSGA